ncbi:MAG: NAD(P)/FAD-dependent oxidoreductase [Pseudomonadota bacterium]
MSHAELDSLILGQGLAGSLLAMELIGRGERVLVVDDGHRSASSTAAAGLINPVTGQRMVKTVGVDACLPHAVQRYRELEQRLTLPLLMEKPMWRLLRREKEQQVWQKRKRDEGYGDYLGRWLASRELEPPFIAPLGGFVQRHTGYLDTAALLTALRQQLQQSGSYRQVSLSYDELALEDGLVRIGGLVSRRLIFCEGYRAMHNPWFDWLPFTPAKGEILSLQLTQPLPDVLVNAGRWLMPRGNGEYRLGATYEHDRLDSEPTETARNSLLGALPRILRRPGQYQVTGQQAGVRPATSDRRPFIGWHPRWPQLGIFNGFGSKGSLLIPWYATRFVDNLLHDAPLPSDADIRRYRDP